MRDVQVGLDGRVVHVVEEPDHARDVVQQRQVERLELQARSPGRGRRHTRRALATCLTAVAHCSAGGITSFCQMYSPRTRSTFFASNSRAMSRYARTRSTWNRWTLGLKSTSPTATQATLTIGRPAASHSSLISRFSLTSISSGSAKMSIESKPISLVLLDAERGPAAGLDPGGIDQAEFHGDSPAKARRVHALDGRRDCRARSASASGKPDREAGTAARSGLDLDRAVVLLDDPVADREAQPGPLADRLGGEERVEDPLADGRVDAAAGIGDLDPDALDLGIGSGADRDRALGGQASMAFISRLTTT